jgi:hypothetical protein
VIVRGGGGMVVSGSTRDVITLDGGAMLFYLP